MPSQGIESTQGSVSVPNLGPRERSRRVLVGIVGLAMAMAIAAALFAFEAPRWTRLALLLPLWGSAIGFFQAREKT